eukprot:g1672.t1
MTNLKCTLDFDRLRQTLLKAHRDNEVATAANLRRKSSIRKILNKCSNLSNEIDSLYEEQEKILFEAKTKLEKKLCKETDSMSQLQKKTSDLFSNASIIIGIENQSNVNSTNEEITLPKVFETLEKCLPALRKASEKSSVKLQTLLPLIKRNRNKEVVDSASYSTDEETRVQLTRDISKYEKKVLCLGESKIKTLSKELKDLYKAISLKEKDINSGDTFTFASDASKRVEEMKKRIQEYNSEIQVLSDSEKLKNLSHSKRSTVVNEKKAVVEEGIEVLERKKRGIETLLNKTIMKRDTSVAAFKKWQEKEKTLSDRIQTHENDLANIQFEHDKLSSLHDEYRTREKILLLESTTKLKEYKSIFSSSVKLEEEISQLKETESTNIALLDELKLKANELKEVTLRDAQNNFLSIEKDVLTAQESNKCKIKEASLRNENLQKSKSTLEDEISHLESSKQSVIRSFSDILLYASKPKAFNGKSLVDVQNISSSYQKQVTEKVTILQNEIADLCKLIDVQRNEHTKCMKALMHEEKQLCFHVTKLENAKEVAKEKRISLERKKKELIEAREKSIIDSEAVAMEKLRLRRDGDDTKQALHDSIMGPGSELMHAEAKLKAELQKIIANNKK